MLNESNWETYEPQLADWNKCQITPIPDTPGFGEVNANTPYPIYHDGKPLVPSEATTEELEKYMPRASSYTKGTLFDE